MPTPPFASVRDALWQTLVAKLGEGPAPEPWSGDRYEARAGNWRLVLDSFRIQHEKFDHTRMVVAIPTSRFRFSVAQPNALSWVGSIFGLLDIKIGDEEFDRRWLIKSNSRSKVRQLLADGRLRAGLDGLGECALSLETEESKPEAERSKGDRRDEVVLIVSELLTQPADLENMYGVLALAIEAIGDISAAP